MKIDSKPQNELQGQDAILNPLKGHWLEHHRGHAPFHLTPTEVAGLDDPEEQALFVHQKGLEAETILLVQGMHCAACTPTVEAALTHIQGVQHVKVDAATRRVKLTWQKDVIKLSELVAKVAKSGYRLIPLHALSVIEQRDQEKKLALWRLVVAFFCMMQVMMYAWPVYVAEPGDMTSDIRQLLNWASWFLSLPVVGWACQPFFENAWRDVRLRKVGMDVPVALGIGLTFGVSSLATFSPQGPWGHAVWFDSLTMLVFFLLLGRYLDIRLRHQTAGALDEVMSQIPQHCLVLKKQTESIKSIELIKSIKSIKSIDSIDSTKQPTWETKPTRQLQKGDWVLLKAGDVVPADGILCSEYAEINEALLTGESALVMKSKGESLLAGSINHSTICQMEVVQMGDNTHHAAIVRLMAQSYEAKPRWAALADRIAGPFLWGIVGLALCVIGWGWGYWFFGGIPFAQSMVPAIQAAIAVLIVTCPCALALATPAALLAAAGRLARRGLLLKNLDALERLDAITHIAVDKTGTLTENKMQMTLQWSRSMPPLDREKNIAWLRGWVIQSNHPVAQALVHWVDKEQSNTKSIPTATVLEGEGQIWEQAGSGLGWRGILSGQTVVTTWHLGRQAWGAERTQNNQQSPNWQQALQALSLSKHDPTQASLTWWCDDQGPIMVWSSHDPLRHDAAQWLKQWQQNGLKITMLTGDGWSRAWAVGYEMGLPLDHIQAECKPQDKLKWLYQQQEKGEKVLMIGDGINDGPVLAGAYVAMCMGHGAGLAQNQADIVIQKAEWSAVYHTWQTAKSAMRIVRQNLLVSMLYNVLAIPMAIMGWIPPWLAGLGMAASSLGVLLNALRLAR